MTTRIVRIASALAAASLLATLAAPASAAGEERWLLWQYAAPAADGGATRDGLRSWQLVRGRSFCQFSLFAAVTGPGDAAAGFRSEWTVLAEGRGSAQPAPIARFASAPNGWARVDASADESGAKVGRYRVRQTTFVGHGRRMSATVADNDPALCDAAGESFFAGLMPLLPAGAPADPSAPLSADVAPRGTGGLPPMAGPAPDAQNPARAPLLTAQSWHKTNASYSHWGTDPSPGARAALFAGQGYTQRSWQFGTDGRYRYRWEVWSLTYRAKELTGMEETGRWRQNGDRITVEPERAVTFVEDKVSGRRLSAEPARTGPTEYAVKMHWLSGSKDWHLVLMPVDAKPTARDGPFHDQFGFANSYCYGPPPRANLIR